MATRPPQLCHAVAGKALGASVHKGFAATWNWLLSWIAHFKPGKGLALAGERLGHPRLDVLIEGQGGIEVTCAGDGQPYVVKGAAADGSGGSAGSLTGNSSGSVAISGALTFASASDSNVVVSTSGTTITVGVYWT